MNDKDVKSLWKNDKESIKEYISEALTDQKTAEVERKIGYKLPDSYINLMKYQNGGKLARNFFQAKNEQGIPCRSFLIYNINGIGDDKYSSLCGRHGNDFWMSDLWGYPNIGVYIAGFFEPMRGIITLDYSKCGVTGEPEVVHLETRNKGCKKTVLAKDFETFIYGLSKKPKLVPFPFEELKVQLEEASKEAFLEMITLNKEEKICSFALLVDTEATMIFPSTNCQEFLNELIKKVPSETEYYKTEPCEWKYYGDGADDKFNKIDEIIFSYVGLLSSESQLHKFRNELIEVCVQVLEELRATHFFANAYSNAIYLTVSGSSFDLPKTKQKNINSRLNESE